MRKWLGVLGLVLVGLVTPGCDDTITNPASCPDVAFVSITATNADNQRVASMNVGESVRLDLSPADNQGNPLSRICHPATASWDLSPKGLASLLGSQTGFNPLLLAEGVGRLTISGCAGAVCERYGIDIR